jgi:two-component system, LytTR family, response regulator
MQNQFIPPKLTFLLVNQKQKIRIPVQSIIMLEGHANYTLIYLNNGKQNLYAKCLGYFEELLNEENFLRVHRGSLINPSFIVSYDKEAHKILLENNLEVSISRRKQWCLNSLKNNVLRS